VQQEKGIQFTLRPAILVLDARLSFADTKRQTAAVGEYEVLQYANGCPG